jgi:hypothetical protein
VTAVTISGLIGLSGSSTRGPARRRPQRPGRPAAIGDLGRDAADRLDIVARLLGDIPVSVVTALVGAFFLAILRRARTGCEL